MLKPYVPLFSITNKKISVVSLEESEKLAAALEETTTKFVDAVIASMNANKPDHKVSGIKANITWGTNQARVDDIIVSTEVEVITKDIREGKYALGEVVAR